MSADRMRSGSRGGFRRSFRNAGAFRYLPLLRLSALLALPLAARAADQPAIPPPPVLSAEDINFFESKIRPILVENCYKCHSRDADKIRGGLLLDSRDGVLKGGDDGEVIVPGDPENSVLIYAVRYEDRTFRMPEDKRLTDEQIADLTEWVRRGAPDPRTTVGASGAHTYGGLGKDFWSFQPVRKPAVPAVNDTSWVKTPVDNFVLAKLESAGLKPNPEADKRTLIRRVTFDLIGIPPTEQEVQAFLNDSSPDAFAKVVDRLLDSPHYGERWGRYWLDVARYSDTKGDPAGRDDPRYPHAWTYRDYVIDAFNSDKPYDQFIMEQLAADRLVAPYTPAQPQRAGRGGRAGRGAQAARGNAVQQQPALLRGGRGAGRGNEPAPLDIPASADRSSLAALGFLTLGGAFDGNVNDVINDRIDVTTKGFLGLTVSCARCHNHKFDPIPTADYYSLYGIFADSAVPADVTEWPALQEPADTPEYRDYLARIDELREQQVAIQSELAAARRGGGGAAAVTPQMRQQATRQLAQVQKGLVDIEANHPGAPARANVILDRPRTQDYPILNRGEAQNRGDVVPRRFLEVLSHGDRPLFRDGSGRLELARDIASPDNPLTARVLVNRIWQHHFGAGFVSTPDDLGNMSSPPLHPELLDYLAARFVEDGWSIKKLHRMILLSAVYQESGVNDPRSAEADPDNKLLWRYNTRRLDFEAVHDSLLAIAGTLDPTVGGKSVPIGSADFTKRRAIYTYIDRSNPAEILTQFDFPDANVVSGKRYETIVPQQSLFLMNSPLVIETARLLTERPEFLALRTDPERVASLYLAIFQRPPTREETGLAMRYVQANPGGTSTEQPPATRLSQQASRGAQQQARASARVSQNPRGGRGFQVEPGAEAFTSRDPLNAWAKLAHALFQTNEAMFYN